MNRRAIASILLIVSGINVIASVRVKDVASVEGVRDNQLVGYGLVVGLAGTGDRRQTVFSAQTLANMLERMGVSVNPTAIQVSNTAAVMITATLPPFAQPGTRIDITASALGDAKNLQGGTLILTPLKGADNLIYAVAQGAVVTGGFVAGRGGNTQTTNHPTVGRVPAGAIVEKAPPSVTPGNKLNLQLRQPDFTTATRIAASINKILGSGSQAVARASSPGVVSVDIPGGFADRPVDFIAAVEAVSVDPDRPSKIVVNEKTGTIVMGKDVGIAPVSILHGALTVQIETASDVSQPAPLSFGETTQVKRTNVSVKENQTQQVSLKKGATVEDLVRSLIAIGSSPRDVIAVLQNLRAAGAIDAEIEVI
jgi:flagellar P-ring protein precursor FlgI